MAQAPEHTHASPPSRAAYSRGCRHPDCAAENARYMRELRDNEPRQRAEVGTRACYVRCVKRPEGPHPECREANTRYQKPRRYRVPTRSRVFWSPEEDAMALARVVPPGRTRAATKQRRLELKWRAEATA